MFLPTSQVFLNLLILALLPYDLKYSNAITNNQAISIYTQWLLFLKIRWSLMVESSIVFYYYILEKLKNKFLHKIIQNPIVQFMYDILNKHVITIVDCIINYYKFFYIIELKEIDFKLVTNLLALFFKHFIKFVINYKSGQHF